MKIEELQNYQGEILTILRNSYYKNKLVHAYIFEGASGSGTTEMAFYMAMLLLCKEENKPCLHCRSCERIMAKSHLNVSYLVPDGEMIKKEQVTDLIHEFSMTSLEDGAKVAIIEDADKLNSSSANSLLKFLEEPVDNYYIFLLTTNATKIKDTILSRCQLIRFKPLPSKFLIHTLVDMGINLDEAYVVSNMTTSIDYAKAYLEEGNVTILMLLAKKIVSNITINKDPFPVYYREKETLLRLDSKGKHKLFLDILLLIYQEIYKKATRQSYGYFEDILKGLKPQTIEINEVINKLDIINKYQERLNYNVNLDLFYTSLMIELNQ